MGAWPLNPWAINFTSLSTSHPSLLTSLKNSSKIPSLSWGYTAGMFNNNPSIFGSLTLGGYDTSRFVQNSVNFSMGADISRDLLVAIQSVTSTTTTTPLLSNPIFALIDSLVPHIWLPLDACQAFEKAFNLTWDDSSSLYLVDGDLHQQLLEKNPTVTFKIGPAVSGDSVSIEMPYGSFDLNASAPFITNSSRYFPLRRAQNESTYTLGRAFLQNAYVIANYENYTFSVSQALYPSTTVQQNIVSIPGKGGPKSGSTGLSIGVIVGIAVAGAVVVICAIIAIWWCCFKKKAKPDPYYAVQPVESDPWGKTELDATGLTVHEAGGQEYNNRQELEDSAGKPHELGHYYDLVELPVNEIAASEVHTPASSAYNTPSSTPANGPRYHPPPQQHQYQQSQQQQDIRPPQRYRQQ
jgi:hypothetical protein